MVYPHLIQSTFMPGIAWMGSSLMEFESEKISLIKREMVRVAAEADKAKAAALAKLESDLRVALHENLSHTTGRPVVWKITLSWGGRSRSSGAVRKDGPGSSCLLARGGKKKYMEPGHAPGGFREGCPRTTLLQF